jgi:hypothetical protein
MSSLLLVSGCATFTEADTVASVGGQTIAQGDFDALVTEFAQRGDIFGTAPLGDDGTSSADQARVLLGAMVQVAAVRELLDMSGTSFSDDDLAPFFDTLPADHPWRELSPALLDLIAATDATVIDNELSRVGALDAAEVEAMYRRDPASTGMLCLRHILVETEDEANDIIDDLKAGADFAALAAERSIEPAAAESGGALVSPDSACITTNQYVTGFDQDFTRGAFATPADGWSEPVESSFGWHVILNRPWDEVEDALISVLTGPLGAPIRLDGLLNSDAVRVDPRYGTWDPPTGRIQPLG